MWATISVKKKEMIQNLKNVFIHPREGGGGREERERRAEDSLASEPRAAAELCYLLAGPSD